MDIRCTLYITNQYFLFNSEVKLYKRNIQVKGRRFYSERIGIIIIKLANKQFIFLENSLFVPKLGCIFVLVKNWLEINLLVNLTVIKYSFLAGLTVI
jgi:hypothetical protein